MKVKQTDLLVIGAGPGGYAAAFYAADRGLSVTLVEKDGSLGGVCLNRGCIPSKALLHVAELIEESAHAKEFGLTFSKPKVELEKIRNWKQSIVEKLSGGVAGLAKKRGVTVVKGRAHFESSTQVRVEDEDGQHFYEFKKAVLAVGSRPALPGAFDLGNPRIMTSTEALELEEVPKSLLVIGGGYIGMELGTVYSALGSDVVMVEAMGDILAGADPDLVRPVKQYVKNNFKELRINTKVLKMATNKKQIKVTLEMDGKEITENYDRVLVSVGRTPNSDDIGLENTKIELDEKGFVKVNEQQETSDSNILAIGDIAGGLLLAHKASKEARVAIDTILGEPNTTEGVTIPAVVFTHPEIAWAGLTETEAKEQGIAVKVAKFPWGASGRALTLANTTGSTKLIIDPETDRILGVGIVGKGAGDLIGEGVLAVEMAATAEDLGSTVHPHPTLNETLMEAAEVFYGHCTHFK